MLSKAQRKRLKIDSMPSHPNSLLHQSSSSAMIITFYKHIQACFFLLFWCSHTSPLVTHQTEHKQFPVLQQQEGQKGERAILVSLSHPSRNPEASFRGSIFKVRKQEEQRASTLCSQLTLSKRKSRETGKDYGKDKTFKSRLRIYREKKTMRKVFKVKTATDSVRKAEISLLSPCYFTNKWTNLIFIPSNLIPSNHHHISSICFYKFHVSKTC